MTIKDDLEAAENYLKRAMDRIDETPNINEILYALDAIESHYQDFCAGCDQDFGEESGYTYKHGTSMEFYIEASLWHDVSIALRKLRGSNEQS